MDIEVECPYYHQHFLVDKEFSEANYQCQKCCDTFRLFICRTTLLVDTHYSFSFFGSCIRRLALIVMTLMCFLIGNYSNGAEQESGTFHLRFLQKSCKFRTYSYSFADAPTDYTKTSAVIQALKEAVFELEGREFVDESQTITDAIEHMDVLVNDIAIQYQNDNSKTKQGSYVIHIKLNLSELIKLTAPKSLGIKIDNTEVNRILALRKEIAEYQNAIEDCFYKHVDKIYNAVRVGMFGVASNDKSSSHGASLNVDYKLSFNTNEYMSFHSRLTNLLDKVCVAKASGWTDDFNSITGYRSIFTKFVDAQASWPQGTKAVIFIDEKTENNAKVYDYCFYAVPNQIYQKIDSLTDDFSVLVFQFDVKGGRPLKKYMEATLGFWHKGRLDDLSYVCFQNYMRADIENYDGKWFSQGEFKKTWHFTEDQVQSMKSCTIKALSGNPARYVWSLKTNNHDIMRDLADEGYVLAMRALAEHWREKDWYHTAALHSDRVSQKKLGWQNSGPGFEIGWTNGKPMVGKVQKGIPVRKGMIIESINGKSMLNIREEELSKLLGAISSGSSVEIKFTNGNTLNFKAQK